MGTIAIDSSALLAILLHEADAQHMLTVIGKAEPLLLSAVTYMETGIVWDNQANIRTNPDDLEQLMSLVKAEVVPVDMGMAQAARATYSRYGKGRHPAGLNMGDCFAYALAKGYGVPLLYKGKDFAKTDIVRAK